VIGFAVADTPQSEAEAALIAGFLGDRTESHQQVDRWIHEVLGYRRATLGADLDDVAQDARRRLFLVFKERRFSGLSSLRTFVWRVTQRAMIDHLRSRIRRPSPVRLDDVPEPATMAEAPGADLEREERRSMVRQVMEALDDQCRRLWAMAIFEELPYRVIAERLGLTEANVKVRALRCRRKALEILRQSVTATAPARPSPIKEGR
jgi:RNA polymerase sigma-70 factor (ECF subfamily)